MKYQSYCTGENRRFFLYYFLPFSKIWHIGGWKTGYGPAVCSCIPGSQPCPGGHSKQCGQQGNGGDFTLLFHSGETPSGMLCPAVQTSVQGRHKLKIIRAGVPFPSGKAERVGFAEPGENSRENLLQPFITYKGPTRKMGIDFFLGLWDRTSFNGFKLKVSRFRLDKRKIFFFF